MEYYDHKIEVSLTGVSREEVEELREYLRDNAWFWRERKSIR